MQKNNEPKDNLSFRIIFEGKIKNGEELEQVKARLTKLFNKKPDKINALFSGEPVTIKKGLDYRTAYKFKLAIENAGALCKVEGITEEGPKAAKASPKPRAEKKPKPNETPAPVPEPVPCAKEKTHDYTTCPNCGYRFAVSEAVELEQLPPPKGSLWRFS